MSSVRRYNRTQLEPHLTVSLLYEGSRIVSFDIHYFSKVITFTHGHVQNFGERDGWYGTSHLTCDHAISRFMMKYIRERLTGLAPDERSFVEGALADYERSHGEHYAGAG